MSETTLPLVPSTWPERYMATLETHDYGWVWPGWDTFMQWMGGELKNTATEIGDTPYWKWFLWQLPNASPLGEVRHFTRDELIRVANQTLRYVWQATWWVRGGRRVYVLDETTTLALMYTDVADIPADELHLPMRSFFLRVPASLGWRVQLPATDTLAKGTELDQPLNGFVVTGEYREDDPTRLQRIRVLVTGLGSVPEEDNTHFYDLTIRPGQTLGEVIHQRLEPNTPADADVQEFINRDVLRLIFGAILYITSANPRLVPVPPMLRPTVKRKGAGKRAWRQYDAATRHPVIYVGGPSEGITRSPGQDAGSPTSDRKPPRPHMRSGHFRNVAVGPRGGGQHVRKWIAPVQVGDWDRVLAWKTAQALKLTEARTRPALPKEEVTR